MYRLLGKKLGNYFSMSQERFKFGGKIEKFGKKRKKKVELHEVC